MRAFQMLSFVLVVAGSVLAQPPVPPVPPVAPKAAEAATPEAIQELVKDLSAEDFDTRTRATESLRKLGEAARPALEEVQRSGGIEQKARAASLLAELDATKKRRDDTPSSPDGEQLPVDVQRMFERLRIVPGQGISSSVISIGPGGTGRSVQTRGDEKLSVLRKPGGAMDIELQVKGAPGEEPVVERYAVADLDELKTKHPAFYERYASWGMFDVSKAVPFSRGMNPRRFGRRSRTVPPPPVPPVALAERVFGVELAPVPPALRSHVPAILPRSVLVKSVEQGSAGAALGLRAHDVIQLVDLKRPVSDAQTFRTAIQAETSETATVQLVRNGKPVQIEGPRPR